MAGEIQLTDNFDLMHCPQCGIAYALPSSFRSKRLEDGKSWYCPNGHSLSYHVTELDRAKQHSETLARELKREQELRAQAEHREQQERRAKHRLQKRIAAGVCPCCNRTFQDLQRHMHTKHKGYELPPPKDQKLIAGPVQ